MGDIVQFPWQQEAIIRHTQRLLRSYQHWMGQSLFDLTMAPAELAQELFVAPFVVVSHGTEPDPIFNYGNQKALELWELSWEEFTQMPSRKSAEEVVQEERNRLLAETVSKGFSHYSGVRISSTGKRFHIENGIIWNVLNEQNQQCGQAALFWQWKFV
ncbi:MAG: MEKHLA domain-containing protein [Nostocaceae cyanobacterium]|nr:MEKHLA domain-containing protein [Nostocaceae cyanobacterium]